ncbi:ATP-binding protein [Shewanella sp. Isolate11]|uniref:ATP-binding response regulator n=1 Tax=Shewanella sp. Isolate11 TaxID=2908530 RepID=UPI001EFE9315|nr:ATP-binding protein [Shewanella sp. Isolate11]MCG9696098.1 ATP-binding protein [Shewanella sp. Isolate11]
MKSAVALTLSSDMKVKYISDPDFKNDIDNIHLSTDFNGMPLVALPRYSFMTLAIDEPNMPYLVYAISHQRMQERMDKDSSICISYHHEDQVMESANCQAIRSGFLFSWFYYSDVVYFPATEHFSAYSLKTEYAVPTREVIRLSLILFMTAFLGLACSILWFFKVRNTSLMKEVKIENRSKIALLSSINHEIRTPINALVGYSQQLRDEAHLTASQSSIIGKMIWSANLLNSVAENTLNYSKAETGTLELNSDRVNIRDYLNNIEQYYQSFSYSADKYLVVNYSDDLANFLELDSAKLFQLITNIINNAFKYSTESRIELHVDYVQDKGVCQSQPGFLRVYIRDFGEGMTKQAKGVLDRPFIQADNLIAQPQSGIGLGLYTCKRIVSLIGGRFRLSSCRGNGTKVLFRFPCRRLTKNPQLSKALIEKPVLLVDDNRFNLEAAKALLAKNQIAAVGVDTASEALALQAELQPKVVIVDYRLAETDGLSLIRQMKLACNDSSVRYFILSANDKSEILDHHLYSDVCFLQKPLNMGLFRSQLMTGCCPNCM